MLPTFLVEGDPYNFRWNPALAMKTAFLETEDAFADGIELGNKSGCCGCLVLIRGSTLWAANVGDCRAVIVRDSGKGVPLTNDHRASEKSEKERIRAAGGTVKDGRVYGVLMPSRTIGDLQEKPAGNPNKKPVSVLLCIAC
jgi:protein phosphatase 2C family protein 2/3